MEAKYYCPGNQGIKVFALKPFRTSPKSPTHVHTFSSPKTCPHCPVHSTNFPLPTVRFTPTVNQRFI